MVCVVPGKLPANVIVAPNSPSAQTQTSTPQGAQPGATIGNFTRRKVVHRSAPRVAAASSNRASTARNAPSTLMTRNGMATKVSAITTARVVNGTVKPVDSYSQRPTIPCRPSTRNSATPPTTGGRTRGTVTSARSTARPRTRERASTQASGTPSTRDTSVASVAENSDSRSACPTTGSVSRGSRSDHGARITSPSRGSTRSARPRAAGTRSGSGTPPRGSGGRRTEAGVGQRLLARVGEHQVDERRRGRGGGRGRERADRILVDRPFGLGERDPLAASPGRPHVRGVHERRIDLAELHLGQRRLDVVLLGVGLVREDGDSENLLGSRH